MEWWSNLAPLTQGFYAVAAFFSLIFLWQVISALIGLGGGEADVDVDVDLDADLDVDVDADMDIDADAGLNVDEIEAHSLADAGESVAAFKILTLRGILAFCMLFCWSMALYTDAGKTFNTAMLYGIGWGVAGWALVAWLVHWMRGLAESGTQKLSTCVGQRGTVYLDIPAGGQGEVRVVVSGVISRIKSRAVDGDEIQAGTSVHVVRTVDKTTIEVQAVESEDNRKGEENDSST